MGKRRPEDAGIEMQVSKESFNAHEAASPSHEDDGGDSYAPNPEPMQAPPPPPTEQRRIAKARRPGQHAPSSSDSSTPAVNPFAGIKFGAPTSSSTAPSPFAFPSASPFAPSAKPAGGLFTGFSMPAAPPESPALSMGGSATAKPTASAAKPTATAAPATKAADAGDEAYYRTLAGLNKGFAQWVAVQMASRPDQSWAAGVLDYVAHCDRLGEPSTSGGGGGGGGGAAASANGAASAVMESSKPSSLFPGLPAPLADKPPSVGTVTFPSAASLFAQPPTGSSLFSQSGAASLFPTPLFGGGSLAPAAPSGKGDEAAGESEGEEEPEEPTVAVVRTTNDDEDALVEIEPSKAVYFSSADKEWKTKGSGRLSVLKDKTTGKLRLVLHAETTGKVMLNASLNASIVPSMKLDKKAVALSLISYGSSLEADNGGKPLAYRLLCKTEDAARQVFDTTKKALGA